MVELVKGKYPRCVGVEVMDEEMACRPRAPGAAASVEVTIDGKNPVLVAWLAVLISRELGVLPSSSPCLALGLNY